MEIEAKGNAVRMVLVAVLACAASAAAAPKAKVRLAERVTVAGARVLLGSIARIDAADAELSGKLDRVLIGLAPLPGQSRLLERGEIEEALALAGFPPWEIALEGATRIQLTRSSQWISEQKLERALTQAIARELAVSETEIAFRHLEVLGTARVGGGRIDLEVEFPETPALGRRLRARLIVLVDGVATAYVEAELEAVRRSKPVPRPVSRTASNRNRRVVRRGQQVVIELEGPGLQITAMGRAKGSGGIGDEIPVENVISGIVVRAIVTGAGRVQVYWSPVSGLGGVKVR